MVGLSHVLLSLLLILVLSGCAGPIGVSRVSPQNSYTLSTDNALGAEKISDNTKAVLQRYNLLKELTKDPLNALEILNDISKTDDRRDVLFALAELSYLQGEKLRAANSQESRKNAQDVFLQSAIYVYFFLLEDGREPLPTAYDIRFRVACDLYNRALWQAFPTNDNESLDLSGGERQLPAGALSLVLKTDTLNWRYDNFEGLFPADSYAVRGFTIRSRYPWPGPSPCWFD